MHHSRDRVPGKRPELLAPIIIAPAIDLLDVPLPELNRTRHPSPGARASTEPKAMAQVSEPVEFNRSTGSAQS